MMEGIETDRVVLTPAAGAASGHTDSAAELYLDPDGDYCVKDATAPSGQKLAAMATPDHGANTGLGDDDHTQYQTAARHTTAHDAAYNNALAISGDAGGKGTLGAHAADGAMHWPRPAQTITVAQNGTGQYASIELAVAAANAAASVSAPVEVLIYPGTYALSEEQTLEKYVSVKAEVPRQTIITGYGFECKGSNYLYGLVITADAGQCCVATVGNPGVGDPIDIDNCALTNSGTSERVIVDRGTSSAGYLRITNSLLTGAYVIYQNHNPGWRIINCEFNLLSSDSDPLYFEDVMYALIQGCTFYLDEPTGTLSAIGFYGISDGCEIISCKFRLEPCDSETTYGISANDTATVRVRNCNLRWENTSGADHWALYSGASATIYVVASTLGSSLANRDSGPVVWSDWLGDANLRDVTAETVALTPAAAPDATANKLYADEDGVLCWSGAPVYSYAGQSARRSHFVAGQPEVTTPGTAAATTIMWRGPAVTEDGDLSIVHITLNAQTMLGVTGATTFRVSNSEDPDAEGASYEDATLAAGEKFGEMEAAIPLLAADGLIYVFCTAAGGHANLTLEVLYG